MKRRDFLVNSGVFSLLAATGGLPVVNAMQAGASKLASSDAILSINDAGNVTFTSPYTLSRGLVGR